MRGHAHTALPSSRVPEARVTGRPRIILSRRGGRIELPDSMAYVLITLTLTAAFLLPVVLGRTP
jgi:hypothetical protein